MFFNLKFQYNNNRINFHIFQAMVPIGSLAFMPGRLIHTNEIMVLLGDNWFTERSAKQAAQIVTRRISGKLKLNLFEKCKSFLLISLNHYAFFSKFILLF